MPSRMSLGAMYALPESPQLFKQILMVAGFDKYFQLVKCFRDEDLRADRQPEFTQLDVEMSFVEEDDVMELVEEVLAAVFKEVLKVSVSLPFPRLTYQESMMRFGVDKPDLRYGIEISEVNDLVMKSDFNVFKKGG